MPEEEIFKKPEPEKKPRKKKPLSQAQLDALAKGRARMAEKKAAEKAAKAQQKAAAKEDAKVVNENKTNQKKARQAKKKFLHNQEKEDAVRRKLQEKRLQKIEEFEDLKYSYMARLKSEDEINQYNAIFEGVDERMIQNPTKLHDYLLEKAESYRIHPTNTTNLTNSIYSVPEENLKLDVEE